MVKVGISELNKYVAPNTLTKGTEGMNKLSAKYAGQVIKNLANSALPMLHRIEHKIVALFGKGEWINNNSVMKKLEGEVIHLSRELMVKGSNGELSFADTNRIRGEIMEMKAICEKLRNAGVKSENIARLDRDFDAIIEGAESVDRRIQQFMDNVRQEVTDRKLAEKLSRDPEEQVAERKPGGSPAKEKATQWSKGDKPIGPRGEAIIGKRTPPAAQPSAPKQKPSHQGDDVVATHQREIERASARNERAKGDFFERAVIGGGITQDSANPMGEEIPKARSGKTVKFNDKVEYAPDPVKKEKVKDKYHDAQSADFEEEAEIEGEAFEDAVAPWEEVGPEQRLTLREDSKEPVDLLRKERDLLRKERGEKIQSKFEAHTERVSSQEGPTPDLAEAREIVGLAIADLAKVVRQDKSFTKSLGKWTGLVGVTSADNKALTELAAVDYTKLSIHRMSDYVGKVVALVTKGYTQQGKKIPEDIQKSIQQLNQFKDKAIQFHNRAIDEAREKEAASFLDIKTEPSRRPKLSQSDRVANYEKQLAGRRDGTAKDIAGLKGSAGTAAAKKDMDVKYHRVAEGFEQRALETNDKRLDQLDALAKPLRNKLAALVREHVGKIDRKTLLGNEGKRLDQILSLLENKENRAAASELDKFVSDHFVKEHRETPPHITKLRTDIHRITTRLEKLYAEWKTVESQVKIGKAKQKFAAEHPVNKISKHREVPVYGSEKIDVEEENERRDDFDAYLMEAPDEAPKPLGRDITQKFNRQERQEIGRDLNTLVNHMKQKHNISGSLGKIWGERSDDNRRLNTLLRQDFVKMDDAHFVNDSKEVLNLIGKALRQLGNTAVDADTFKYVATLTKRLERISKDVSQEA